ncbi:MAG TPA: hypothetical protein VGI72_05605 [Gaiellales bacterium]
MITRLFRVSLLCLPMLVLTASVATGAASRTAPGQPAFGRTRVGVASPHINKFDQLTRHHDDVDLKFGGLGSYTSGGLTHQIAVDLGQHRITMLTLNSNANGHPLPTGRLAAGAADADYVDLSRQANAAATPVWIRPMQEMNGWWMSYSAFNQNGSSRGRNNSTATFRQAFRRISIIMHGGTLAQMNSKLTAVHMKRIQASLPASGITPSHQVAIVWNPQGAGSPPTAANAPMAYYPGSAYVDYVGDDLYAQNFRAYWKGVQPLYNLGKPFMLGEWAPWGTDDGGFVAQVFKWAEAHPRTAAIVYYDLNVRFNLQRKALAAYRAGVANRHFKTVGP